MHKLNKNFDLSTFNSWMESFEVL